MEGAAKSLHLPRLHALQVTPAGVSVEGDFVLGWPDDRFVHCHPNLNSDCHRNANRCHRNADRVREEALCSPQYILRPERRVGAVLAFDCATGQQGMPLSGREELSVVDFRQPEFFVEFQFHAIREFHLISVPVPFDFLKLRSRPPGRYCRNNLLRDKSAFNR